MDATPHLGAKRCRCSSAQHIMTWLQSIVKIHSDMATTCSGPYALHSMQVTTCNVHSTNECNAKYNMQCATHAIHQCAAEVQSMQCIATRCASLHHPTCTVAWLASSRSGFIHVVGASVSISSLTAHAEACPSGPITRNMACCWDTACSELAEGD